MDGDESQKVHLNFKQSTLEKLDAIADEMDINRTALIRIAVYEYLKKHD